MGAEINWKYLSEAVSHFTAAGYRYIEAPWSVPDEFTRATCPDERFIIGSTLGDLVGSSEQSFLYLDRTGQLGTGKFVACTPCFRNEGNVDDLHQKTFMKVELYRNDSSDLPTLVEEAAIFYRSLLPDKAKEHLVVREFLDGTIDLELGGIEIGSYGVRSYLDTHWMYGTALAEPRFSTAIRNFN